MFLVPCVRALDPLELELKVDLSTVWVLGTEQGSLQEQDVPSLQSQARQLSDKYIMYFDHIPPPLSLLENMTRVPVYIIELLIFLKFSLSFSVDIEICGLEKKMTLCLKNVILLPVRVGTVLKIGNY